MIDSGDIYAEIDDARGMVRFQEDPEEYNSPELMARLDAQIQQSMRLAEQLQDTNHVVSGLCTIPMCHKIHIVIPLRSTFGDDDSLWCAGILRQGVAQQIGRQGPGSARLG